MMPQGMKKGRHFDKLEVVRIWFLIGFEVGHLTDLCHFPMLLFQSVLLSYRNFVLLDFGYSKEILFFENYYKTENIFFLQI